jgi:hypothetical protein
MVIAEHLAMLTHRSTASRAYMTLCHSATVLGDAATPAARLGADEAADAGPPRRGAPVAQGSLGRTRLPMAELLRELIADALKKPSTLREVAERVRRSA